LIQQRRNKVEQVFKLREQWNLFSYDVRQQLKISEHQEQDQQTGKDQQQITDKAAQNVVIENKGEARAEKASAPAAAVGHRLFGPGVENPGDRDFELAQQHFSKTEFDGNFVGAPEQHRADKRKEDVGHPDA